MPAFAYRIEWATDQFQQILIQRSAGSPLSLLGVLSQMRLARIAIVS
jgi:hypothetical protein